MVVKVYVSGISGNKEVKKRQQRVLMILDSKHVSYNVVDITEPGKEQEKEFMQQKGNAKDSKYPLPPQIFNEEEYCGDYEEFDLANEIDELDKFLKVPINNKKPAEIKENSDSGVVNGHPSSSREASTEKEPAVEEPSPISKPEEKEEEHEEKAEVVAESQEEAAKVEDQDE